MFNPQKLLLAPMCGLGDAICYAPFVQALRARFPNAEIVVIVASDGARAILECSAANIEIIVFNRGQQRGWRSLFRLLRTLRARKFDVLISGALPDSTRAPLFSFLCGARFKIGANTERLRFVYDRRVDVPAGAHYFERYRLMLAGAGITLSPDEYRPALEPPMGAREAAMRLWRECGLDGPQPVLGLASGADLNPRERWQPYLKRWDNRGYAEVAKWASEEMGAKVVMFGSRDEAGLGEEIAAISGVPLVNLCGRTGIAELQWLIGKCTAFVSNDTGMMHMAGALGTQLVALFGPTSSRSFRPPGTNHRIVEGRASCSPCHPYPTCDLKSCIAMENISAPQVIDCISGLLNFPKSEAGLDRKYPTGASLPAVMP